MFNFLHTFNPEPILVSFGPVNIYWYGVFVVAGLLAGMSVTLKLAGYYRLSRETLFDLMFWLIIGGLVGARLYHVFLEWPYYLAHPLDIFKFWRGGLAIHGALFAGLIIIFFFARQHKISFWLLVGIMTPGLALAQALGRWGNYFNQELMGRPTDWAWGIPVSIMNRPLEYISAEFFHPTFLYESLGNLLIFLVLISIHFYIIKKNKFDQTHYLLSAISYLILYSGLRLGLEFIRVDPTPAILGLRWPQIISILIIIFALSILLLPKLKKRDNLI